MITQRPFDGTPNPEAYVPRNATNRCLFDLEDWVFHGGPSVALLAGPSGIGKTLMLRLLEARTRGRYECIYIGNPTFGHREFCISILDALKVPHGESPEATLDQAIGALGREGSRVLLLIDDAELLPTRTESWLRTTTLESDHHLIALMAVVNESHCERLLAGFGREARLISLTTSMQRMETANFIHSELSRTGVPRDVAARFDERSIDGIHERSEGLPAQVQHEATMWLQQGEAERAGETRPLALGSAILSVGESEPSPWMPERTEPELLGAAPPVRAPAAPPARVDREATAGSLSLPPFLTNRSGVPLAPPGPSLAVRLGAAAASGLAGIRDRADTLVREFDWAAPVRALRSYSRSIEPARWKRTAVFAAGLTAAFGLGQWTAVPVEPTPIRGEPSSAPVVPVYESAALGVEEPPMAQEPVVESAGSKSALPAFVEVPVSPEPSPSVVIALPEPAKRSAVEEKPKTPIETPPAPVVIRTAEPPPAEVVREEPSVIEPAQPARIVVAEAPQVVPEPEPLLVGVNAHPWATIWIDGAEVGETPLAELPLLPGLHKVAALMPDGRRIERDVMISDDNRHLRFR